MAVTVVTDDPQKVFIALFHDTTDAADCMAFVAREILTAFIAQHGAELGNVGHNLRDFQRFQSRILTVLRDSVRPVLRKCMWCNCCQCTAIRCILLQGKGC